MTPEELESIVATSAFDDQFYLKGTALYRDNSEGSDPELIGDISNINPNDLADLLNK